MYPLKSSTFTVYIFLSIPLLGFLVFGIGIPGLLGLLILYAVIQNLVIMRSIKKGGIVDKGVLNQVVNKVWAYVNEPIEVKADFRNIGERSVFARFKGTVKLDDKIVRILETEEIEVPAGEKAEFVSFFIPEEPGRYVISGKVIYNKKFTFEKGSILNVNPPPETEKGPNYGMFFILLIYLIMAVTIIFIMRKIIKEKRRRF